MERFTLLIAFVQEDNSLTTPGKIFFSFSAAVAAFGFPPFWESSNSKSDCLTGFEYETVELSTNVTVLTPQPYKDKSDHWWICLKLLAKHYKHKDARTIYVYIHIKNEYQICLYQYMYLFCISVAIIACKKQRWGHDLSKSANYQSRVRTA